jgi:hypothetical protein
MARPPKDEGPEADPAVADPPYIGTKLAAERAKRQGGGGGDGDATMEGRVSKLEAYMEVSREDLREIRTDLKAIIAKFGTIPTKSDLDTWKWQWLLASVAIFAVIIGSIIGGLAWLEP